MDGLFEVDPPTSTTGPGSLSTSSHHAAPLAVRMRPRSLEELVGQQHLLAAGSPLRRLIEADQSMSLVLWGPPGTGKTTIAAIVSGQTDRVFVEVSAVAAGVKEVRAAIDAARSRLAGTGKETVLFVDEVHRLTPSFQGIYRQRRVPSAGMTSRDVIDSVSQVRSCDLTGCFV